VTPPRPGSVEFWAVERPDAPAVVEASRALTYGGWNRAANRIAELLHARASVGQGDRVAVCTRNRVEWFVTQAALAKLGALLVPVSYRLTPAEVHYIVADAEARALIFDHEDQGALSRVWTDAPPSERPSRVALALSVLPAARDDVIWFEHASQRGEVVERVAASSPRSIVYTSGTTGRPRGVVTTRSSARRRSERPSRAARDIPAIMRNLLGAPLNHAAGQASARATHAAGGCVYLMPRFDAEQALRIIDREKITTSFLVPTMLNRIVSLPDEVLDRYDLSSIQLLTTGASPCPQAVKEKVIARFGAHCLFESYGSTEVGLVSRMLPGDHLRKPGSCGRLLEGVEVRLVDERGEQVAPGELGEIQVRTPNMIERYLNEGVPDALVDGFFATGDVGRFDDDGYLYIVDRKKDMIIAGGVNIYPAEIESALREHPDVLDAAAFGIPHADLGEQVKAVVECVRGSSVTQEQLLDFVEDRLAPYKRPRSIEVLAEIPRNPTGKVLKAELRAPYWRGRERAI
jgi:long-chain acyl-CoA synthetase